MNADTNIYRAKETLAASEAVLIGAGAGLSAAAGLDYTDEYAFAERFPGMLQYGVKNQYQLMGARFPDEALKWGYLSVSLNHVYKMPPLSLYEDLRALVGERDCFVLTSNVDRFFHRNGFDETKIHTPQGDYALFQCETPCSNETWDGKPLVERMLPSVDRRTQRITDHKTLPVCPNCGGPVFMNVRAGYNFIEAPYSASAEAFSRWVESHRNAKITVLEIGAGFNTPTVIRRPMEIIARNLPKAQLIRVNPEHADGPEGTISLRMDADAAISALA